MLCSAKKRLLVLVLPILAACQTAPSARSIRVPTPQLPELERHVEPLEAAVSSQLSQINLDDPVEIALLQAKLRVESGENLYKQGQRKRAKEEFDSALDLILDVAAT